MCVRACERVNEHACMRVMFAKERLLTVEKYIINSSVSIMRLNDDIIGWPHAIYPISHDARQHQYAIFVTNKSHSSNKRDGEIISWIIYWAILHDKCFSQGFEHWVIWVLYWKGHWCCRCHFEIWNRWIVQKMAIKTKTV